jgi:hypothetical protein
MGYLWKCVVYLNGTVEGSVFGGLCSSWEGELMPWLLVGGVLNCASGLDKWLMVYPFNLDDDGMAIAMFGAHLFDIHPDGLCS